MLVNSSLSFSVGDSPACNINRNKSVWESCGKGSQCQMLILEGDWKWKHSSKGSGAKKSSKSGIGKSNGASPGITED